MKGILKVESTNFPWNAGYPYGRTHALQCLAEKPEDFNSLIVFDIDHVRILNDTHGMERVNELLVQTWDFLQKRWNSTSWYRLDSNQFLGMDNFANIIELASYAEKLVQLYHSLNLKGDIWRNGTLEPRAATATVGYLYLSENSLKACEQVGNEIKNQLLPTLMGHLQNAKDLGRNCSIGGELFSK